MSSRDQADAKIAFYGDPHGDYRPMKSLVSARPNAVVFIGVMDLSRSFDNEVKPLTEAGIESWYIHGNHDTDREDWHDFLFESKLGKSRNLNVRVENINGVRIAGLAGVFRSKVWHPRDGKGEQKFQSRAEFMRIHHLASWRDGLPLGQRSTIYPEDVDKLANMRADVLVSHEAPSCHRYGFSEIDLVAQMMGAKTIIHGHHHESYEATLPCGIKVIGLDKAEIATLSVSDLVA
jgi:predicted phosphodiesterase